MNTIFRAAGLLAVIALLFAGPGLAQDHTFPDGFVGAMETVPPRAIVGDSVDVLGSGFEPGATLDLIWLTYDLDWKLGEVDGEYDGNFLGLDRVPKEEYFGSVVVDADGSFATTITVPEDFGGVHNILVRQEGINLNQAGLEIRADMTITPEAGALGSDITITVTGLHVGHPMVWYQLTYDHHITGFVSAVESRGTVRAVIPAVGEIGPHLIRLEDSPFGQPYLALDTSPYAFLEIPSQTFTVLDGEPVLPTAVAEQVLPALAGVEPQAEGVGIWADPWAAAVGSEGTLYGRGFEPGTAVRLEISGMVGSRVTDSGFSPVSSTFLEVTTDAAGSFDASFAFPDTHGGLHRITAYPAEGDRELSRTQIKIFPMSYPLERFEVRYGETLTLHLKGIGWTQTENIFGIVVDNTYIGYACGFSTNGDVRFDLEASWAPGWHFIDIYPSFYRNKDYSAVDEAPFLFRHALVTWDDHPSGFHFRYAFEVLPFEERTADNRP